MTNEERKQKYAENIRLGICVRCWKVQAKPSLRTCWLCGLKQSHWAKQSYQRRIMTTKMKAKVTKTLHHVAHKAAVIDKPETMEGINLTAKPSGNGCKECLASGGWWLHLNRCAECGHVGCCDSSPNRHSHAHYHETKHPIIQRFEPGEEWFYNWETDKTFNDATIHLAKPIAHPVNQPVPGGNLPDEATDSLNMDPGDESMQDILSDDDNTDPEDNPEESPDDIL